MELLLNEKSDIKYKNANNEVLARYKGDLDYWEARCQMCVDSLIENMNDILTGDAEHDKPFYAIQFKIIEVCSPLNDFQNCFWPHDLYYVICSAWNELAFLELRISELWKDQHCKYEFDYLLRSLKDFLNCVSEYSESLDGF
nr:hypothetical protein HAGR004_37880 [Bdellovibrio sp. HAGR004]